jgi:hypothetical protein
MKFLAGCALVVFLFVATDPAQAATLRVRQDGTGDYTTVAAAITAAVPGDRIEIGPGSYPQALTIAKNLELYSTDGADATVLDGANNHRILWITGGVTCTLRDLTFARGLMNLGENGQGGAIHIDSASDVIVEGCVFEANYASWDGGAIYMRHAGTAVSVTSCRFTSNRAGWNAGACGVASGSSLSVTDCRFEDNLAFGICGGVAAYYAEMSIGSCLFLGNSGSVGAIRGYGSKISVSNCTLFENVSTEHASVSAEGGELKFDHNIVASDLTGAGLEDYALTILRTCNIYWNNARGAVLGDVLAPGEAEADPLFCDWPGEDFSLCVVSPALPQGACGLIGAFGQGCEDCGPVPTETSSWGAVKNAYR